MGFAWAILTPLLVVAAGVFVRVALLHASHARFRLAVLSGVMVKGVAWAFVSGAVGTATTALSGNAHLVSKVYFPRETLPLSTVLASTVDSLVAAAAVAAFLPAMGWRPGWALLWVPVLAATLFALVLAAALVASCGNLFFRDVKYVVQLLVTFGVIFTPVFYEPAVLGERWIGAQMLNPLAPILEGLRLAVAEGHDLLAPVVLPSGAVAWSPWYLAYSALWAVVGLVGGAVVFHRAQFRFAEYV
jgi:ABC-type polysaccharide/polyol phosphate export permease